MNPITPRPTLRQRLLGVFIVWQLLFLVIANLVFFLQRTTATTTIPVLADVTDRWAEATGQLQGWSLYAPHVPTQAAFVATELRWPDGRAVTVPSSNEPADFAHFFRPPGAGRLLNYEAHLRLALLAWAPQDVRANPEHWQRYVEAEVRHRGPAMQAYLEWSCRGYLEKHPETPLPAELVLWVRLYPIPAPPLFVSPQAWGETKRGASRDPIEIPLMRWRPDVKPPAGSLTWSWEWFDVTTAQFRWVRAAQGAEHE